MTRDLDGSFASSLKRLLVLTEKAEQWQHVLEEPSAVEILGDLLVNEVGEGRMHQGAALGWLLGARACLLPADYGDYQSTQWGEPIP